MSIRQFLISVGYVSVFVVSGWTVDISTAPTVSLDESIERRVDFERYASSNPFVLMLHRPNYILPLAYNFNPGPPTYDPGNPDARTQNMELKFQLSLKANVIHGFFKNHGDVYVAYTQQSYWQAYNLKDSGPFRETNYEPEVGTALYPDWSFFGFRNPVIVLALSHQSNGRSGAESRGWNRIFSEVVFQKGRAYFTLRPWYRIQDSISNHDNGDIDKFMGYGEFYFNYAYHRQVFGVMFRNNFRSDNKSAVQADWTFPLVKQFKGYLQYFYGYGESLIDYNRINRRVSLGINIGNRL